MVCDIIEHSWAASGADTGEPPAIGMSPPVLAATDTLRRFLFARVYDRHSAEAESERARVVVRQLYKYLNEHPERMPPEYSIHSEEVARQVVDFIAGMTDQYALNLAAELLLI
jgi:dGTPase